MKITQDIRDYAKTSGLAPEDAIAAGLESKAAEFKQAGKQLYAPAPAAEIDRGNADRAHADRANVDRTIAAVRRSRMIEGRGDGDGSAG